MTSVSCLIKGLKKRYFVSTLFCPLCMVGEVLCECALPMLLAKLIDEGVVAGEASCVQTFGVLMALVSGLSLLFGVGGSVLGGVSATAFSANLRHNLFSKIQAFNEKIVKDFTAPSLLTRLTTDVTTVQNVFSLAIRLCFRAPFMMAVGFVMAFKINSKLAIIFCVAIPVLALAVFFISRAAFPRFSFMLKKVDALSAVVEENLRSIRTVKSYTMEASEFKKASDAAKDVKVATVRSERLVITLSPLAQCVLCFAILAILFFGAQFVTAHSMTSGELVSFVSYTFTVLMSVMMIAMIFVDLTLSRASLGRIIEVFSASSCKEQNTPLKQKQNAPSKQKQNTPLKQEQSTPYALGQWVTFALAQNTNLESYKDTHSNLCQSTSSKTIILTPRATLFSGTVRSNLLWGNPNAIDEELKKALCDASFESVELDAEVKEHAVNFSGGQKQRLALARALVAHPANLILQEALNACDERTIETIKNRLGEISDVRVSYEGL